MAFGDLLDSDSIASTNPGTGISLPAVSVVTGNLVVAVVAFRSGDSNNAAVISDDLSHSWRALDNDFNTNFWHQVWWTLATQTGSMTVSTSHTSSTGDETAVVGVFDGPFLSSPLDKNPAILTNTTSPFISNSTGTLTQAKELAVGTAASANGALYAASSPWTLVASPLTGTGANTVGCAMSYLTVSSTDAITAEFTSATSGKNVGIATFKAKATGAIVFRVNRPQFYARRRN